MLRASSRLNASAAVAHIRTYSHLRIAHSPRHCVPSHGDNAASPSLTRAPAPYVPRISWIRHYTMTAQNMESQRQKAALQQQQLDTGLHPQKELAMPCANVNRSGHCLDYLMQYDWMRKQDAVSRGALTLEQARHHRPECVWSLRKMERLQLDRKPA